MLAEEPAASKSPQTSQWLQVAVSFGCDVVEPFVCFLVCSVWCAYPGAQKGAGFPRWRWNCDAACRLLRLEDADRAFHNSFTDLNMDGWQLHSIHSIRGHSVTMICTSS